MTLAILPAEPTREEWLAARLRGIGGSEVAAIVGMNPYRTAIDVYCEKLGLVDPQPETRPMRLGKRLEPVLLAEYQDETGNAASLNDRLFRHPDSAIVLGTPDALAERPDLGVEFKAVGFRQAARWGEPGTDDIPEEYLCQVAIYQAITGRERWDVAVLIGGDDFRVYTVQRNRILEDSLITSAERFWRDHIVKQEPPPLDGGKAARRFVERSFPEHRFRIREATAAESELASALAEVRADLAALKERESSLRNLLTASIGDAEGIASVEPPFQITWRRTKDSKTVDWKAVVEHLNPKPVTLIAGATKTKPGVRRFCPTGPLFENDDEEDNS